MEKMFIILIKHSLCQNTISESLRQIVDHLASLRQVCLERFAANKDPWTNQPRIKALHSVDQTKRLRNYDCYCKVGHINSYLCGQHFQMMQTHF